MSRSRKISRTLGRRAAGLSKLLRAEVLEPRAMLSAMSLKPDADTYVRAGSYASYNFGNSTTLVVKNDTNTNNTREAQLRFDMRQLGGTLGTSKLYLAPVALGASYATATVRIRLATDAADTWAEGNGGNDNSPSGELTWNNRVKNATAGAEVRVQGKTLALNRMTAVDVTSLVNQASLNTNAVATFVIDLISPVATERVVSFASREYSRLDLRPVLVVEQSNQTPTVTVPAKAAESVVTTTQTNLSTLGADDGGEVNLRYSWSVTTGPLGRGPTLFSENDSNAAKNTTVVFPMVGNYTLEVTMTDTSGATVASSVSVSVVATPTRITVTPPSTFLIPGATQKFTATVVDQFGGGLAAPAGGFTWKAVDPTGKGVDVGVISTVGMYTAPSILPSGVTSIPVTVRAAAVSSGVAVNGESKITVGNFYGLRDPELALLTRDLANDGILDRRDTMQILRAAGTDDGKVDAVELNDLHLLLKSATQLKMPFYVQVLAADVINGNRANATYQRLPLGNLVVNSPAAQLNKLVDKWFLGTDHPTTTGAYATATGQLFVGGPQYTDMKQGNLGDCYFISSMGSVAKSAPTAIQNMFIDNGDGTWSVRFYADGVADYVTVDRALPVDNRGRLMYANSGALAASTSTELWTALLEKAYAQWNETGREGRDGLNAYDSLSGGWTQVVCPQLLGKPSAEYWQFNKSTRLALIAGIQANKAVTISTTPNPGDGLYGPHAYVVIGYNQSNDTFLLYNPWGYGHPAPLTLTQLARDCQCFVVADPSGNTPAAMVGSRPANAVAPIADLRAVAHDLAITLDADQQVAVSPSTSAAATVAAVRNDLFAQAFTHREVAPALEVANQEPEIASPAADVVLRSEIILLS